VRVTAGEEFCPAPGADEQATLERINAHPDVRLACQLRPQGDISVIPLVRTAQPIYRPTAPQRNREREIVVLVCDFRNIANLAGDHLPQDQLYLLTLYVEGVGNTIRAHGGTLSFVELGNICALFGLDSGLAPASRRGLQAAGAIERVISDLNNRFGRRRDDRLKISVSIHAGHAAVGEIGSSDPPIVLAIGDAIDVVNELRRAAAAHDKPFAISERVYTEAGLGPAGQDHVTLRYPGSDHPVAAYLSDVAPLPSPSWTLHGKQSRRAALRRFWAG
jgi:adenylate cyclase